MLQALHKHTHTNTLTMQRQQAACKVSCITAPKGKGPSAGNETVNGTRMQLLRENALHTQTLTHTQLVTYKEHF